MNLAPYSKAIVAAITAIATIAVNFGVPEGSVQAVLSVLFPILGIFGVYQVRNEEAPTLPPSQFNAHWSISLLAAWICALLLLSGCANTPQKVVYTAAQSGQAAIDVSTVMYDACLNKANAAQDDSAAVDCQFEKDDRAGRILKASTLLTGAAEGMASTDGKTPQQMIAEAHSIMAPILGALIQVATQDQRQALEAFR